MALTPVFSRIIGPALFASLVFLSSALALKGLYNSGQFLTDFRAFYCAGQASSQRYDPYHQEPLYACEAREESALLWRTRSNVAVPAPVFPAVLTGLALLSRIPYTAAAILWTLLGIAAFAGIVVSLRRLSNLPYTLLVVVMVPALLFSLHVGQLAPMAIALACFAALCLRKNNALAGSMLLVAAVILEPHMMLPSAATTFTFVANTRRWLVLFGVAAALISLSWGPALNAEYLSAVLPSQAASEVSDIVQFSLTLLLHLFGAADKVALAAGTVQYAVCCVAGIAAALYLAKRRADAALAVIIPMAFAVFGGPYVHLLQIDAALPAIVVLCSWQRSYFAALALVFVAVPWLFAGLFGDVIPLMAVVAGTICWRVCDRRPLSGASVGLVTLIALTFANQAAMAAPQVAPAAAAVPINESSLAQASWAFFVAGHAASKPGALVLLHVPTWIGLAMTLGLIVSCCLALARSQVATPVRPAQLPVADV